MVWTGSIRVTRRAGITQATTATSVMPIADRQQHPEAGPRRLEQQAFHQAAGHDRAGEADAKAHRDGRQALPDDHAHQRRRRRAKREADRQLARPGERLRNAGTP